MHQDKDFQDLLTIDCAVRSRFSTSEAQRDRARGALHVMGCQVLVPVKRGQSGGGGGVDDTNLTAPLRP